MNTIILTGFVGKDAESRTFEAFNTKMLYGNYFSKAIDNLEKELETA